MKKILMLVCAAYISMGSAAAQSKASPEPIDELMQKSGLAVQMGQIEPMVQAGLTEQHERNKGAHNIDVKVLQSAVTKAYAADVLRADVKQQLTDSLSQKDVKRVLEWLSTDLGKRLTALEEQSTDSSMALLENPEEIEEIIADLPAKRKALLSRFVKAVHAGETSAAMAINTALGITYGMAMTIAHEGKPDLSALKNQLNSQRPQLVATYDRYSLAQFAMIYESISNAELGKYVAFAESAIGKRYHGATMMAIDKALTSAAKEMGKEIAKPFKATFHDSIQPMPGFPALRLAA